MNQAPFGNPSQSPDRAMDLEIFLRYLQQGPPRFVTPARHGCQKAVYLKPQATWNFHIEARRARYKVNTVGQQQFCNWIRRIDAETQMPILPPVPLVLKLKMVHGLPLALPGCD